MASNISLWKGLRKMFHRVKSEVQDSEQRVQQRQKVDLDYRQDDDRVVSTREQREPASEPAREEAVVRSYAPQNDSADVIETRTESRPMIRAAEDKDVQGKYAREPQQPEQIMSRARSADVSAPITPAYQRPLQPSMAAAPVAPVRAPAPSYSQGYSAGYSVSSASSDAAYSGDRSLTIGRGINMSGEIEACDHLVVEGTVEAALKGAKVLDIAESGTFYGTVEIEEATIAGRFEGDLTVNGRLTIRASGVITGSIAYRELEVEAGAMLDGRMTPLKGTVDPKSADKYRAGSDATAMAKAKELLSKKDNREPANTESALFSKAHSSY